MFGGICYMLAQPERGSTDFRYIPKCSSEEFLFDVRIAAVGPLTATRLLLKPRAEPHYASILPLCAAGINWINYITQNIQISGTSVLGRRDSPAEHGNDSSCSFDPA